MNTEQMRAEFEAVISDYFEHLELNYNPDFTGRIVSSKHGDRFLYGSEHTRGMQLGYEACCKKQEDRIAELESKLAEKQSKIDALMLEYCPDDMTPEQIKEWGESQVVADKREFVVGLPEEYEKKKIYSSYEEGWNDMRNEAIEAIEAAGGTVKTL